ncbi:hypothetical protein [Bacillus sp. MUM 13]|uniref:hypothetical protein n=1 Tax=Bacillus sp. MUM 13 TaxID=1678001 RepID=UPI0008F56E2B|nr:hypothetical protein [Bacillus sp. MUM 13]OIK09664.1 hypothetical protein BIV59_16560 [Bacillus sp. MUM 13]
MSYSPQPIEELLCINAEKVYDWVILQNTRSQNILAAALGLDINVCAASSLSTRVFLVDAEGNPLPPNAEVTVLEPGDREERTFVIDGALVTLERVTFLKTFFVAIEFKGILGTTPFVDVSKPIAIEIPESLFLCAPDGTRLAVRISDLECAVRLNCTAGPTPTLTSIDLTLTTCQSVQAVADVTIEVKAEFCQPRDILSEQCPTPAIPPQCPVLFPGHDN